MVMLPVCRRNKDKLPTYRGHHEQNMALTGIYARLKKKPNICNKLGWPGSTNLVTVVVAITIDCQFYTWRYIC